MVIHTQAHSHYPDQLHHYLNKFPSLGKDVYLSPGVKIVGEVILEDDVNIWFNSVVRGDVAKVQIGAKTNVQDLCMLHVTEQSPLIIGKGVSIGHSVVIHGATIGNYCLLGMGSIILDNAEISEHTLVAAGTLVSPNKKYPPGVMLKGRPARIERDLTPEELKWVSNHYLSYIGYKNTYLQQMGLC